MAERRRWFPAIEPVTLLARGVELPLVDVLVAGETFTREAHKRFGGEERRVLADIRGLSEFGRMTSFAVETGVFAGEGEAHSAVIVAAPVEANELERPAEMFLVAFNALTPCQRAVKARPGLDPCAKFLVALQALLVDDGFAQFVARRAGTDPFEPRVANSVPRIWAMRTPHLRSLPR
jgi:hypothetical protein